VLTSDTSHLDYRALVRESKRLDLPDDAPLRRIAVLSDAAVQHLVPLIEALLARRGVRAEVYLAEFDAIELEIFNADSGLYRFAPDAVVVLNALNSLRLKFYREAGERATFADRSADRMAGLWDTLRARSQAVVLQANFPLPYERPFGNFDHKVEDAFYPTVQRLNARIAELARQRSHVLINDVEGLASYVGRMNWWDERLWTLAKAYCSLEHLPRVAQNVVDIVLAGSGQLVKCVVLDLDNTLWGGVIGDDGMEGIAIGPFGEGEPFHRLQHFLLELQRRGIVLAVCSKNEQANAIEPFRSHPEMVLREEHIAVFVANWHPKPDNIRHIREALNIGFDSIVFLDDNPFERELVRKALPEVIVPELPEDPSDYLRVLSELNLFETTSYSDEDRRRATLYRENAQRSLAQSSFSDISDYLRSLDMQVTMRRFDAFHLPRIVQLLQRSNQFNLTTRRYSLPECEAMMEREECLPFYVKLADKFGDNGLISVVVLNVRGAELEIDSWLMSCRVLGRGVEQYTMNEVVALARERGCEFVTGRYIPTAKNGMVREFYSQFGFERIAGEEGGEALWRLDVSSYDSREVFMKEVA
jgi:FkbH-like protein